jgi:hypothetical protein
MLNMPYILILITVKVITTEINSSTAVYIFETHNFLYDNLLFVYILTGKKFNIMHHYFKARKPYTF